MIIINDNTNDNINNDNSNNNNVCISSCLASLPRVRVSLGHHTNQGRRLVSTQFCFEVLQEQYVHL